jgi:hypothetical protein
MRRARRIAGHTAAVVIGAIVGGTVVLAIDGATRDVPRSSPAIIERSPIVDTGGSAPVRPGARILLAWSPGGLPARSERVLGEVEGVREVTTVSAGLDWLVASRTSDGNVLDRRRGDLRIPLEVAVVDPVEYAKFVAPSERASIQSLSDGEAVIPRSESELRGAGRGLRMNMEGARVSVEAVVSDVATNGYEVLMAGPVPSTWVRVDRFVLMQVTPQTNREAIHKVVRRLVPGDRPIRIRAQGEVPFLRYGDAVLPQLVIKSSFGEFAAAPNADGSIDVDPAWRRQNIVQREVPILGSVTCHRGLLPQLRDSMKALLGEGLGFTVDPSEFAGCYSARFIDANPGGRLSHHSWGIAVDLNVASNPAGTRPDQDPRLVEIMEEHGFTWGGRWLIPDGMHFEWVRFP